jgi:hypothetical protein
VIKSLLVGRSHVEGLNVHTFMSYSRQSSEIPATHTEYMCIWSDGGIDAFRNGMCWADALEQ